MQIFVNPNYNFVKYRWHGVAVSVLIILAGIVAFFAMGLNLSIDFSGGAAITLKFRDSVPLSQLRSDLPDASIQQYGKAEDKAVLIRLPKQRREGDYAGSVVQKLHKALNPEDASGKLDLNFYGSDRIAGILMQADPDLKGVGPTSEAYYKSIGDKIIAKRSEVGIFTNMGQATTNIPGLTSNAARVVSGQSYLGRFNILNQETVGPQVGKELQTKALLAILLSSIAMGAYIWLRFDFVFGLSAVVCIIHDVLVALAALVLLRLEFSLNVVAALLTIVGYSINDTVVMYDRVRENKRKIKKPMSMAEHLNLAINQTLSRTILTSGSVFLVLVALLVFGGEVIRGFSWILLVGTVSGTYSTLLFVPAFALVLDRLTGGKQATATAGRIPEPTPRDEVPAQPRKRKSA